MVGTTMTIEREIKDARSIQDASGSGKRRESQSSSSLGKKPRASNLRGFQSHDHLGQGQMMVPSQTRQTLCYFYHQWGRLGHSLFLHPPVRVKGINISPKVLHKHLLLHIRAREARVQVEVKDKSYR